MRGGLIVGVSWRAYLAGLIDGDGCISIHKRKVQPHEGRNPSYSPALVVNMVKSDCIRKLRALYGGSINVKRNRTKPNANDSYAWTVTGNNLRRLLGDVLPYLILKEPQAEAALCALRSTQTNPRRKALSPAIMQERDALVALCHRLNRRGRDAA